MLHSTKCVVCGYVIALGTTSPMTIDDNTDRNDWYIVVDNILSSSALTSLNIISQSEFRFRQLR